MDGIKTDYCDLDTSVALREIGCYIPHSQYCYTISEPDKLQFINKVFAESFKAGSKCEYVPAVHLYDAQKWLRKFKKIHIEVYACAGGYIWEICKAYEPTTFSGGTTIYTTYSEDDPKLNDAGKYDSYEVALLEGIKAVITQLKTIESHA